jgi:hypothetical protein
MPARCLRFAPSRLNLLLLAGLLLTGSGCKSAYYSVWDKLGYEKRDLLVSEVKDARDDQEAAKKQFKTTLERFKEITNFQGGDLEAKYKKLNSEYESSESRAKAVTSQIADVEETAKDLFDEWSKENSQYTSAEYRRSSEQKLRETKERYQKLIATMKAAEQRMKPVLAAFKDQVLYLKHNLNAAAIASLQTTASGIQTDVDQLIRDMEASIAEADAFISQLN